MHAVRLKEEARIAGISERTLRRADESLGVQHFKEVGVKDGNWLWYLPTQSEDALGTTDHGSDKGIGEKVATFSQGKIRPNPSFDEWLLTGKVAIDAQDGHLRHSIEDGHLATFPAGHLPPEDHGPLGSPDPGCQWTCIECGSSLPPDRKYRCVHCQTRATVTNSGVIT